MPRSGKKGKDEPPATPPRPGWPAPGSILSEKTFISPKGKRHLILETDETDPYDKPQEPEGDRDEQ